MISCAKHGSWVLDLEMWRSLAISLEGINDFNWTVIWAEPDKFIGTCFSNRLKHHKEKFR